MKRNNSIFFQVGCILLLIVIAILFYKQSSDRKTVDSMTERERNEAALSVIFNRKSVRSFVADKPVSDEDLLLLMRAGMAAPSGKDNRPWEFIVISEREVLDSLANGLPYARMLQSAPQAIVVCGDTTKSFYWYLDCSAVTQNILLAAEALGLGAVWTAAYPYEDRMEVVMRYTGLPAHVLPLAVIPVGYPNGDFAPKDKFDESRIHFNKW